VCFLDEHRNLGNNEWSVRKLWISRMKGLQGGSGPFGLPLLGFDRLSIKRTYRAATFLTQIG
jgi:hypothetical protein